MAWCQFMTGRRRAVRAPVFESSADMMPPGLDAPGEAVQHPHARFRSGFAGEPEVGVAGLVHGHALRHQLVPAEHAVDQLAGVSVLLESAGVVAALVVEHDDLGALANRLEVAERTALGTGRSAVHSDPEAIGTAGGFGGAIVQVPDLHAPGVVPHDPIAVRRIVPVGRTGNGLAGLLTELALAIVAVADAPAAEAAPTVVGEALRMAAPDDLAQDVGEILVVVGAVHAGDVAVGVAVGIAAGVPGEPVRVGLEEILPGAVGVHAGEDDEAVLVRGLGQFAEEVAIAQKLRAVVQRVLAGIVGDDAAGVDDDALHLGLLPVAAPPGDVVADRVALGDVGLSPAVAAAVPGESGLGSLSLGCGDGEARLEKRSSGFGHGYI